MLIILDTNIICADFQLRGQAFRVFLETFARAGFACAVPAVVLEEAVHAYESQLRELERKFTKMAGEWRRITGHDFAAPVSAEGVRADAEGYTGRLRETLAQNRIAVLPYPNVSLQDIARRAMNRRKPFREGEVGYRDTLIWETILAASRTELSIAFVTANSRDFAEASDLHSDLRSELHERHPNSSVQLFGSLAAFVEDVLKPSLSRLENFGRDLELDAVAGFSLVGWIATKLEDTLASNDWASAFVPLNPESVSCWINSFAITGTTVVDDVLALPSGARVVSATVSVTTIISVSPGPRAEFDREVVEFFGGDLSGDPTADYPIEATVSFTLILDRDSNEVLSIDIDTIETGECRTEINPHPRKAG